MIDRGGGGVLLASLPKARDRGGGGVILMASLPKARDRGSKS